MMRWFSHYWHGYLRIRFSGLSPERFFNLCSANHIEIWKLQSIQDSYEGFMTVADYRKCRPLVRKARVRLRILNRLGLPFFLQKNKKRKSFFFGFLFFFILLYSCSLFIWDISFEGNYRYTDDMLLHYFNQLDIQYGMMKHKISCEDLEAELRNHFPEITWVSARVSGTRLLVKLKENEVLSSVPEKDESPSEIVASEDGIITRMVVRQGIPEVSVGDTVEKGQILVSSRVPVTNDSEELVTTHYVHADADIYARTTNVWEISFPNLHNVSVNTGKHRTGWYIRLSDWRTLFMLPVKQEETWKFTTQEHQVKLFADFYLPVYYGKTEGKEYSTYERFYTEAEKKTIADHAWKELEENLMEKGVHIIENNVKILDSGSLCRIQMEVTGEQLVGRNQPLSLSEERNETDECN